MAAPGVDANALLARLQSVIAGDADAVPPGHFTARELARSWGFSGQHTARLITRAIDAGAMGVATHRIRAGRAGIRPVPHYFET